VADDQPLGHSFDLGWIARKRFHAVCHRRPLSHEGDTSIAIPQNLKATVTIAAATNDALNIFCAWLLPSMRNPLDKNEYCAELGRYIRLMGSLHPRIDTTTARCDDNPVNRSR
jgi:hypothetical protein